jgi:phospholipid/cholesterol/gamma-HCH transport system substrate-binding protein
MALVAGAIALTALATAPTTRAGEPGRFRLRAEFVDAGAILPGNDVKIDGVRVGSVSDVTLRRGRAVLTLSVESAATPIHGDATARIRPVSLLGERYVDLKRGSPDVAPLPAGATLPASQTGRSVDLDEVLDAVDQPTGAALAALIASLGTGVDGRGDELAATLGVAGSSLARTAELAKLLEAHNGLLSSLVERVTPVVQALAAGRGATLDHTVAAADAVFGATAARRAELEAALGRLPGMLRTARGALAEVGGLARQAQPSLEALRPLTTNLRSVSSELRELSGAADPALTALDPLLPEARRLVAAARPVIGELRPAGGDLQGVAASGRVLAGEVGSHLDELFNFIRNWALVTNGADGVSHYLRAHMVGNPASLQGPSPVQPPTPTAAPVAPPAPADPAPAPSDPLSATGLSEAQEWNLLRFLLGEHR